MPKAKQNLKESRKKGKQKNNVTQSDQLRVDNLSNRNIQTPETADEFLAGTDWCKMFPCSSLNQWAAGVEFEEAGEKWRAGDAAKSTRFFIRAVDNYETALQEFPQSFNLAYNK